MLRGVNASPRIAALLVAGALVIVEAVVFAAVKQLPAFWLAGGLVAGMVGGLYVGYLPRFVRPAIVGWAVGAAIVAVLALAMPESRSIYGMLVGPFAVMSLAFILLFGSIGCLIRTPTMPPPSKK
jgi:hypothetical protein